VHECIPQGDNHYISIAAASILAKTYHDDWIEQACKNDTSLDEKYKWSSNMGYGTKAHREGIIQHGITDLHRKTFCKKYTTQNK
jgi:ribonuclease HII